MDKYALRLAFQTKDDNKLQVSSRLLENTSEGIQLQIIKEDGSAGKIVLLFVYIPGHSKLIFQIISF